MRKKFERTMDGKQKDGYMLMKFQVYVIMQFGKKEVTEKGLGSKTYGKEIQTMDRKQKDGYMSMNFWMSLCSQERKKRSRKS